MITKEDALKIINDAQSVMGIRVVDSFNEFLGESASFMHYEYEGRLLIDPSSLTSHDFSALVEYAGTHGLRIQECWNDWGRFIVLM
jgi:hypothetical protein